jgi:hypothetical protein
MRHLARKSAGMDGEIDEADGLALPRRHLDVPAEVFLQGIRQAHRARGRGCGQHGAGKCLGHGTDAQDRLAVRRPASGGGLADARDGALAIAHRPDDEAGHLVRNKGQYTGEFHRLLEQGIVGGRAGRERPRHRRRQYHPAAHIEPASTAVETHGRLPIPVQTAAAQLSHAAPAITSYKDFDRQDSKHR